VRIASKRVVAYGPGKQPEGEQQCQGADVAMIRLKDAGVAIMASR